MLVAGTTLGPYKILSPLGAGGMGEVYRAEDPKHQREVAIKVLTPEVAAAVGSDRFRREIAIAARLTHPHILPVHDSGSAEGLLYYVMPYIEGESLRQRLTREKQLPVDDALRIARETADALDYAHQHGVIHRDIKPENILLQAGHAVVADFGIARAIAAAGGEALTQTGFVVGTPAYMSPEQAAGGGALDGRSDLYSLGCVLYEMLAGQPPFTGPTAESLAHQHLNLAPRRVTDLRPAAPPALAAALDRALAKRAADRFATALRFSEALGPATDAAQTVRPVGPAPARVPARLVWIGAVVAVAAVIAAALWLRPRQPREAQPLPLTRLTYDTGLTLDPSVSLDGKLVAYASDRGGDGNVDIWVQYVNRPTAQRLTQDPAVDFQPSLSPDGSLVAFHSTRDGGGIYLVSTMGGSERRIADRGSCPRFSPDGSLIAYVEDVPYAQGDLLAMYVVPTAGGQPRRLQSDFGTYRSPGGVGPVWSPDGRHVLFPGAPLDAPAGADWWVAPVDGGRAVPTGALRNIGRLDVVQFPCAWFGRQVIFSAGTTIEGINLYRARMQPGEWQITGPVERLTTGPGMKYGSVSGGGLLVMSNFTWTVQIWSQGLDPTSGLPVGAPSPLGMGAKPKFDVSVSKDGSKLTYSTYGGSQTKYQSEARVRELASGREWTAVTSDSAGISLGSRLSPDGSLLTYQERSGRRRITFLLGAQEAAPRQLCDDCTVLGFFGDSRHLLVQAERTGLARQDLATGKRARLVQSGTGPILGAHLSPDDRWIAIAVGRGDGSIGIYAAPVRDSAATERDWIPVAEGPAWRGAPQWSPDGRRLYFLSDEDGSICIWARRVDPATKRPVGDAFPVLHNHRPDRSMYGPRGAWSLAVTADRLIFNAAEVTGNIWQAELGGR